MAELSGINTGSCIPCRETFHENQCVLETARVGWPVSILFSAGHNLMGYNDVCKPTKGQVLFSTSNNMSGALCKQRPFQLWIPKLYWSLIIICKHKAIHDRLLLCYAVMFNIISMCVIQTFHYFYLSTESPQTVCMIWVQLRGWSLPTIVMSWMDVDSGAQDSES